MIRSGRRLISIVAASATVAGVAATASVAFAAAPADTSPKPGPAAQPTTAWPAAPVEKVIVSYKSGAAERGSDAAAAKDAKAKGAETGESLSFDRRLANGLALVDLGGKASKQDLTKVMDAFRADPSVASVDPDIRAFSTAVTSNDTEYGKQWDFVEATGGMNIPGAWSGTAEPAPVRGALSSLTEAELHLALLVGHGASNQEAAAKLYLSVKAVEARLTRIYQKLEVRSRAQLATALNAWPGHRGLGGAAEVPAAG